MSIISLNAKAAICWSVLDKQMLLKISSKKIYIKKIGGKESNFAMKMPGDDKRYSGFQFGD